MAQFSGQGAARLAAAVLAVSVFWRPAPAPADLIGHGGPVRALAVSPDGARVVTGGFDYTAILWDFGMQRALAELEGHEGPVNDVIFAGRGRYAVTAADDGAVRIFDSETGAPARTLQAHGHKAMGLAAAAEKPWIASAGWDRKARVFRLDGEMLFTFDHPAPVNAVAFLENAALLATGAHDGRIRLFRLSDGAAAGELEGHGLGVTRLLAAADGGLISAGIDGSVRIWNAARGEQTAVLKEQPEDSGRSQIYALARAPGGAVLAGGEGGRLVRWNVRTGEVTQVIPAHSRMLWAAAVTPDGRFAVTGGLEEAARVWHLETGDRIGAADDGAENAAAAAAAAADNALWRESAHPGAALYSRCAGCHALSAEGPRRSGPHLGGLFGRRAGTLEGYRYSRALLDSDIVWSEASVFDLFDRGPDKVLPGTKMPVQRMTDPAALSLLVDFLKTAAAGGGRADP